MKNEKNRLNVLDGGVNVFKSSGFEPEELYVVLLAVQDKLEEFKDFAKQGPLAKAKRNEYTIIISKLKSAEEKILMLLETAGVI